MPRFQIDEPRLMQNNKLLLKPTDSTLPIDATPLDDVTLPIDLYPPTGFLDEKNCNLPGLEILYKEAVESFEILQLQHSYWKLLPLLRQATSRHHTTYFRTRPHILTLPIFATLPNDDLLTRR